jgi:molecular chaperone GrpE
MGAVRLPFPRQKRNFRMTESNANSQHEQLDLDHELPLSKDNVDDSQWPARRAVTAKESSPEKVKTELDALRDRMARLQADFENVRRRAAKEQQDFKNYALVDALKSLLPILDSFDLALQAPARSPQEYRSGFSLIRKQLRDALGKLGLTAVPAKGELFDPFTHQAVDMVDSTTAKNNHVLEELQRGYKIGDRLLRPAMVRVARNPKQ